MTSNHYAHLTNAQLVNEFDYYITELTKAVNFNSRAVNRLSREVERVRKELLIRLDSLYAI